ncbi:MAG: hypothetical protein AB1629_04475 [Candidatus Omnitrophota bacterium]
MKKAGLIFSISLIILLVNNGKGIAMGEKSDYKTEIKEKFKQLDLSDGLNKEEAIIIAQNYVIDMIDKGKDFYKKLVISKSSILEEWESEKDWAITVPIRRGLALMSPVEYILFVNKETGTVTVGGERK